MCRCCWRCHRRRRYYSVVFVKRSAGAVSSRFCLFILLRRPYSEHNRIALRDFADDFIHWRFSCRKTHSSSWCQRSEWRMLFAFLVIAFGCWMQFDYAKSDKETCIIKLLGFAFSMIFVVAVRSGVLTNECMTRPISPIRSIKKIQMSCRPWLTFKWALNLVEKNCAAMIDTKCVMDKKIIIYGFPSWKEILRGSTIRYYSNQYASREIRSFWGVARNDVLIALARLCTQTQRVTLLPKISDPCGCESFRFGLRTILCGLRH